MYCIRRLSPNRANGVAVFEGSQSFLKFITTVILRRKIHYMNNYIMFKSYSNQFLGNPAENVHGVEIRKKYQSHNHS